MKTKEQIAIVNIMKSVLLDIISDEDEVKLRSYSGRGMYGKECVGVVFDRLGQFAEFCIRLGFSALEYEEGLHEDAVYILSSTREDSMGRSVIYYWPQLEWNKDYDNEGDKNELD